LSLLAQVSSLLQGRGIPHALIGAGALAVHGVPRATADLDLLTLDETCLEEGLWSQLRASGVEVEVRRGDASDPLAGVVRLGAAAESAVDVIVGRHAWQRAILRRATATSVAGAKIPIVGMADLVLLKLYAGGPQDAWDIDQILDLDPTLATQVEALLPDLPRDCASLFRRILEQRQPAR
jgi:hypothetical protein